jgi:hypothetical protein
VITQEHSKSEAKPVNFAMFRLTKSKVEVGLSPNTLRAYNRQGLAFYRRGKCVFISRAELENFIRGGGK